MYLGPLAPPIGRSASWPAEASPTDVAWLNTQWELAGGRPAPKPLTPAEREHYRASLGRYFAWDAAQAPDVDERD